MSTKENEDNIPRDDENHPTLPNHMANSIPWGRNLDPCPVCKPPCHHRWIETAPLDDDQSPRRGLRPSTAQRRHTGNSTACRGVPLTVAPRCHPRPAALPHDGCQHPPREGRPHRGSTSGHAGGRIDRVDRPENRRRAATRLASDVKGCEKNNYKCSDPINCMLMKNTSRGQRRGITASRTVRDSSNTAAGPSAPSARPSACRRR